MRCLALAEMLGDGFERRLAIVDPDAVLVTMLADKRITVVPLLTNDVAEFSTSIEPDEVVVLDGYSFDEAYQRTLKRRVTTLVFIDDFCDGYQVADVIINHTGGITEYDYQAEPYTQFFLGPRYALLRPPFFGIFGPTPEDGAVFVSMGGADPQNVSLQVLESLRVAFRMHGKAFPVRLVLGLFHPNRPVIEAFAQTMPELTILSNLSAQQMADELKQCRLAITACSTVAYEACASGRPLIAIQTAENQSGLARFFTEHSIIGGIMKASQIISELPVSILIQLTEIDFPPVEFRRRHFDKQTPQRFRHIFARLCSATV